MFVHYVVNPQLSLKGTLDSGDAAGNMRYYGRIKEGGQRGGKYSLNPHVSICT
jgi:hypothetical protein